MRRFTSPLSVFTHVWLPRNSSVLVTVPHFGVLKSQCGVVRSDLFIGHQINVVGERVAPLVQFLQPSWEIVVDLQCRLLLWRKSLLSRSFHAWRTSTPKMAVMCNGWKFASLRIFCPFLRSSYGSWNFKSHVQIKIVGGLFLISTTCRRMKVIKSSSTYFFNGTNIWVTAVYKN